MAGDYAQREHLIMACMAQGGRMDVCSQQADQFLATGTMPDLQEPFPEAVPYDPENPTLPFYAAPSSKTWYVVAIGAGAVALIAYLASR